MKKSSFAALVLGTISMMLFAIGMCMTLLPEWNAFWPGVIFAGVGIVLGMVTWLVWRKMTHKAPIRISGKTVLTILVGVAGALLLGVGMCFCMVWQNLVLGVLVGLFGILLLLCLIPLIKGFQD